MIANVSTIPTVMRAAIAHSFDDVRVEEVPVPTPGPGEALLRMTFGGICTGDVTPWYINRKAAANGGSVCLGHESAGVIAALGENTLTPFSVGDRVVPHHHAPCLRDDCHFCSRGRHVQCPAWKPTGFRPGGLADYMVVSANCLAHDTRLIPHGVADDDAALTEPLATSYKAVVRQCGLQPGESLAILGTGVMGMLDIRVARDLNDQAGAGAQAGRIIATDLIDWRLKHAAELGADVTLNPQRDDVEVGVKHATDGRGADVVIVGPGLVPLLDQAFRIVAPGGTVCLFMATAPGDQLQLEPAAHYFREVRYTQSYSAGPDDMAAALELIERGVVSCRHVVTHRADLADISDAFRDAATPGDRLKTMIRLGTGSQEPRP